MTAAGSLKRPDRPTVLLIGLQSAETRKVADRMSADRWQTIVCSDVGQATALLRSCPEISLAAILLSEDTDPGRACRAVAGFKRRDSRVPVFLVGNGSASESARHALRAGANHYFARPLAPDQIARALRSATNPTSPHARELEPWSAQFAERVTFASMIGAAPGFRAALDLAAQSSKGQGSVLIEGESGTGKEMLARAIHAASSRSQVPLRAINVGGTNAVTLESRLFGHVRGAFVGAFESQAGLLQQCDGATLLLDEVNRLPVSIQERLAEALEERRARPMGASHSARIDVRVIALSEQRLADLVEDGAFNAVLYESLAESRILLPALRERRDDIALLAHHFLRTIQPSQGVRSLTLDDEAISLLRRLDWPGNISQLNEALLRAATRPRGYVLTAEDFVEAEVTCRRDNDAPTDQIGEAGSIRLFTEHGHVRTLAEIEADVIRLAIERYGARMSEIAQRLGIGRSTLYRKLADLDAERLAR